jgi:hypothetical protein
MKSTLFVFTRVTAPPQDRLDKDGAEFALSPRILILSKAIKEDWQPPAGFQTRQEREEQARANREELEARVQAKTLAEAIERDKLEEDRRRGDEEWQAVETFLKSLPSEEREAMIDAAIQNSDEFTRDFAKKYRLNPMAGSGEFMYQMALKEHILPLMKIKIG